MLDARGLRLDLASIATTEFTNKLISLCEANLSLNRHGDLATWQDAIQALPNIGRSGISIVDGAISLHEGVQRDRSGLIRSSLMKLAPWRKGPFRIADVFIDTEWRSDLKWQRINSSMSPLTGRRVLDVGCGNGYYALRMAQQNAGLVIGIDPTLLYVAQFFAISQFLERSAVHVLPLRLNELPESCPEFDTVLSMGVLYHQRDPDAHLELLMNTLRRGGELVLETLIVPGDDSSVLVPESRYARMRNIWHIPSRARLIEWLIRAGFDDIRVVDVTVTSVDEQRSTEWMPFESLREALDPTDSTLTIEGLPAPRRICVLCNKPAY